jgi:hypothetical protein
MRRTLVALAALSMCALMHAQSAHTQRDSATVQSSKASSPLTGKSESARRPGTVGKPELRDIKPQPSPTALPLLLRNAGMFSAKGVARGVAWELAKQDARQTNGQNVDTSSAKANQGTQSSSKVSTQARGLTEEPAAPSDGVMEFQPVPSGTGPASSSGVIQAGSQSKSPLKRVHGDLYGATGAAGQAASGSVGATSKSGKTSVYIQSDETRSKVGQPQQ